MRFEVMAADLDVRTPQFDGFQEDFQRELQMGDPGAILAQEQGIRDQVPHGLSDHEQHVVADLESQFAPEVSQGPVPQIEFSGKKSLDQLRADIGAILVGVNTVVKNEGLAKDIEAFNATSVRLREAAQLQAIEDMNQFQARLEAKKSKKDKLSDYDLAA